MKKIIASNAKINLGLNITGKLLNGYHLLDMVMAPISLSDKLELDFLGREGSLTIITDEEGVPTGKSNILYKIYDLFYETTGIPFQEIKIKLEKNIPHQAGLGGGSSNGAFFLKELNSYHGNPLEIDEMIELSKKIGADIPFFLFNTTCRVSGIGEQLERVENNLQCDVIVVKPDFGVSTAEAYRNYSFLENKKDACIEKILKGLKENNLSGVIKNIDNHLEQGLLLENIKLRLFREKLLSFEGVKFFMSGSGSAYFSLVKKDVSNEVYESLKKNLQNHKIYLCSFL